MSAELPTPERVPLLTEVLARDGGAATGDAGGEARATTPTSSPPPGAPSPSGGFPGVSTESTPAADVASVEALVALVLGQIEAEIEARLEARMAAWLREALAAQAQVLVRQARGELSAALGEAGLRERVQAAVERQISTREST